MLIGDKLLGRRGPVPRGYIPSKWVYALRIVLLS